MENLTFEALKKRSMDIRERYHELEQLHHGSEWSIEEDALAFLTDAGLVGRNIMSQQERWPKANSEAELEHKLGECIWWLAVLADRAGIDIQDATTAFLVKTEKMLAG